MAAGGRIPKTYKRYLGDKLPQLINKMAREGSSIDDIKRHVETKLNKSIDKVVRNRSKVGEILTTGDVRTKGDERWRGKQIRHVFEFNQAAAH